jgi:hypothetical protein
MNQYKLYTIPKPKKNNKDHCVFSVDSSHIDTHKSFMQFPEQWDAPHDDSSQLLLANKKKRKRKNEVSTQSTVDTQEVDVPSLPPTETLSESMSIEVSMENPTDTNEHHIISMRSTDAAVRVPEEVCSPIHLSLHSLISRVPFKEMMQQMFADEMVSTKVVPIVTKAYEESFLREPMFSHETPCVCGDNCEFNFIDPMHPFIGVGFKLQQVDDNGATMCVLCSRKLTQELFYKMVYSGERFLGFIQRYGNLCQQPGEYAREAVLVCPKDGPVCNMPLPIVAHQRHRYSVFMQHGVKYLKQHHVAYEDFQTASSSMP